MSAKRIRYDYEGPIGISRQVFRINGKDYRVMVHTEDMYFEIIDNEGIAHKKGEGNESVRILKQKAKRALSRMGYDFEPEARKFEKSSNGEDTSQVND